MFRAVPLARPRSAVPSSPSPGTAALLALVAALAAGCHDANWLTFDWSDRPVLCSQSIDDAEGPPWKLIGDQMLMASAHDYVVLLHAHKPGKTVRRESIEHMLDLAAAYRLPTLTYRELDPDLPDRRGLAFALDDNSIGRWFELRELFLRKGARVTFFVSRWHNRSAAEREQLRILADDGHDIEPHSVDHRPVSDFVRAHGVQRYLDDELLPSMDGLVGAGYPPPTIYAYPFGERPEGLDEEVLKYVPRVRVSPHSCPY